MIYKSTTLTHDTAAVRWRVRLGPLRLTLHSRLYVRITRAGVTRPFWLCQKTNRPCMGVPS